MKKIEAIIKPFKIEDVEAALHGIGVLEFAVSEVHLHGSQGRQSGPVHNNSPQPRFKIECTVEDTATAKVLDAIANAAFFGHAGDGEMKVLPIEQHISFWSWTHRRALSFRTTSAS